MNSDIFKTKTFWTSISGLIGAGAAYATGDASAVQAISIGFQALLAIFLRDGMISASGKF